MEELVGCASVADDYRTRPSYTHSFPRPISRTRVKTVALPMASSSEVDGSRVLPTSSYLFNGPNVKESDVAAFRTAITNPPPVMPLKEGWEIPIIDLTNLRSPIDRENAVQEIGKACEEWGFFQVLNHGIPEKVMEDMWEAYELLFQVPRDERKKFDVIFLPPGILQKLAEWKEEMQKYVDFRDTIRFRDLNPDDEEAIASAPEFFRKPACTFYRGLRETGFELLEAISESLGKEKGFIRTVTGNNPAISSSIHCYSPCPDTGKGLGLNPHKDIDTLTVLMQDLTGGLQVLKEDRWVDVKPLPGSLVVNVGEVIQAISNGLYRSVLHRVVTNNEKKRGSIACFLLPTPEAIIEPLPHLVTEENPALKPAETWASMYYNAYAILLKL